MNSCITVMPRHIIKCLIENQENAVKKNKAIESSDVNVTLYLHIDDTMHSSYNTSIKN